MGKLSDIAWPFSFELYNIYWLGLLLMTFIQAFLALKGTNVFQRRSHNRLRLTNEILARTQLSFACFCAALFVSASFPPDSAAVLKLPIAVIFFGSLVLWLTGIGHVSDEHAMKVLRDFQHICEPDPCGIKIKCRTKFRILKFNLIAFLSLFPLICLAALTPKSATLPPTRMEEPEGSPILRYLPYAGQPSWYEDHVFWLLEEAKRLRGVSVAQYALGEASYTATSTTIPFEIVLNVREPYVIVARVAFLQKAPLDTVRLEELKIRPTSNSRELRVPVFRCEKADKVVVLFRVDRNPEAGMIRKAEESITLNETVWAKIIYGR
jgi:hypothetical protein